VSRHHPATWLAGKRIQRQADRLVLTAERSAWQRRPGSPHGRVSLPVITKLTLLGLQILFVITLVLVLLGDLAPGPRR
jgi:hypothetical protein